MNGVVEAVLQSTGLLADWRNRSPERNEEMEERDLVRNLKGHEHKIHILVETRSLDRGGLEEVIFNTAASLDKDLFQTVIVCVERGGFIAEKCQKLGIPVEILRGDKEKEYREILDRHRIDLLVTHYSTFGIKLAFELEIPIITFLHNIYCWLPDDILGEMKNSDRMIDRYVAVSEDVKTYTVHRFNIPPEKIEVIPNGIDLEQLESKKGLSYLTRKEAGLEKSDYVFLNVGAFTPAKAHPLIVAAMKEVVSEHPEAKVLCIGAKLDPKYEEFVRTQIKEQRLEKHVRLVDFTNDLHSYYRMADAFLLPSTIEGWSLAVMEAMAYGLPLILTRVGGAAQVIENEDIGLLVENRFPDVVDIDRSALEDYEGVPPNVSSLKEAMLRFLTEKAYWKEAGKQGEAKVRERFDIRTVAKAYDQLFLLTVAFHDAGARGRLITQRKNLLQERRELSEERQQLIKTHEIYDTQLKGMDVHLQQRGKEIQELRQLFEARYQQLDGKIEYVLVRMSIKERIRARLFKFLKAVHLLVPKRLREKYRFHYRRFFFEKVFPDGQRFEARDSSYSVPSSNSAVEKLDLFVQDVVRNRSQLMVVYTTDPYLETRGQRSTWLTKEFVRRGIPVVFFYWRWDPKEAVAESGDPLVVQVPIDEFSKVQEQLFSSGPNLERIFLIEFPDARLFEKINLANAHSFITIFDCVDDWEEFAKAGQALWYDAAVERYLVRNANLVVATNQRLAQKLKEMGASHVPIIPNGVDLNSFDPKTEKAGLQRGTLTAGYFGHLTESWFDWDVVTKTAQARKDWVFHIIGYGEPSGLKLPENVCFWGRVEHRDLPAYARIWDVAMIPFKEGRLTEAVDPIKLYEYLHLGLPVVATNMDHLCGTPGVYPCLRDDFEKALVLAKRTPFPRQEAERFVRSNTWEKRADRLLEEIDRVDLSGDVLKSIG